MRQSNGERQGMGWWWRVVVGSLAVIGVEQGNCSLAQAQPFAYVTNHSDGTVSVIDTATNMVGPTVTVGGSPGGVAVTPDGQFVYVANFNDNTVSV
ncbi:MAG: YncE family protein, partial [Candidatus Binatia bacterium]